MPELLTTGCLLTCSMGTVPTPFTALELPGKPTVDGVNAACEFEVTPGMNISPFVLCRSPENPTVIAATAAALGVPTPGACTPLIPVLWAPPSPVLKYLDTPLATIASKCACAYGGEISIVIPVAVTAEA